MKVKRLTIDTNAFLARVPIWEYAEDLYTIPEVIQEMKGSQARHYLDSFPIELKLRTPSPESIKFINDFTKKTGDYITLSLVDIKLLALTYELEKDAHNGTDHLRSEPDLTRLKMSASIKPPPTAISELPEGFYHPHSKKNAVSNSKTEIDTVTEEINTVTEKIDTVTDKIDTVAEESEYNYGLLNSKTFGGNFDRNELDNFLTRKPFTLSEYNRIQCDDIPSFENSMSCFRSILPENNNYLSQSDVDDGITYSDDDDEICRSPQSIYESEISKDLEEVPSEDSNILSDAAVEDYENEKNSIGQSDCNDVILDLIPSVEQCNIECDQGNIDSEPGEIHSIPTEENNEVPENNSSEEDWITESSSVDENDSSDDDDDDDDDDGEGWITPGNIHQFSKPQNLKELEDVKVACMTTDYAMQNTLRHIGIEVIGFNGLLMKQKKTYTLRCSTCFKTTNKMDRVFCPFCGHKSLRKVTVTFDQNGDQKIWLSTKYLLNKRGTKYPIPNPRGGKDAVNPVLVADQRITKQRLSRKTIKKMNLDPLSENYVAGERPFGVRDVYSKFAQLGITAGKSHRGTYYFEQKNPNEVKRSTVRLKKNKN